MCQASPVGKCVRPTFLLTSSEKVDKMGLVSFQNRDDNMEATIELVSRDVLLSNPGVYGIPDEQLHYPFLYESDNGNWYMTYREGPHFESKFGPGNRVQCIQSRDRGLTWLPWLGLQVEPLLRQLFVTRLKDTSLISYRCRMAKLHQSSGTTLEGTAIILRSQDEGATWHRHDAPVSNLPFSLGSQLISLWGHGVEMPDGRLLWAVYSREGNTIAGVVHSTDGGHSFEWLANVCEEDTVGERREPGLVRLPSGELLALIRCGTQPSRPMVEVRSSDGGLNWSPPRRLARPGVCPQLLLLGNGVLVCSYGTRRYVHVMASWDGAGHQWSEPLVLYEGQTSGYSNIQALTDNRFRIIYQEGTFDTYQEGGNRIVRSEIQIGKHRST